MPAHGALWLSQSLLSDSHSLRELGSDPEYEITRIPFSPPSLMYSLAKAEKQKVCCSDSCGEESSHEAAIVGLRNGKKHKIPSLWSC